MAKAAASKKASSKKGEVRVKPNDLVTVKWKNGRFHKEGTISKIHRVQAEKLAKLDKLDIVKPEDIETEEE